MELTAEQTKLVNEYGTLMLLNGIKQGVRVNKARATKHIKKLYKEYLDAAPPEQVIVVDSPEAAIKIVAKSTGKSPESLVDEILYMNLWTWWGAYYHAGITILKESSGDANLDQALIEYEEMTREIHAILPCEKICFVIEYPKAVCLQNNDLEKFVLHKDGGLALEYRDGTGFAWLNGVEVPDWLATTPVEKLSAKKVLAESNTDVRREGLKRMGIATALKKLRAKVIDKMRGKKAWEHYDLLEADFGDKKRRFLKMKNPSTGDFLIEQVTDSCNTVLEARAMQTRETKYVEPEIIT